MGWNDELEVIKKTYFREYLHMIFPCKTISQENSSLAGMLKLICRFSLVPPVNVGLIWDRIFMPKAICRINCHD